MEEAKRRILCVEDDDDTCEMLTLALQMSGYEVVSAQTFADAITKALSSEFDAYILDSRLPDGSGVDLCKEIREFNSHTPILFYSADAYPKEIEEAMSAGAQAYMVKPIDPMEVERNIRELLQ
jgi:two-component system, OmpR family, response regulator RegX3